jgi:hypothetical protein
MVEINLIVCIHHISLPIYPLMVPSWLFNLAAVNSAAISIVMLVNLYDVVDFSGYVPKSGTTASHGSSGFSLQRIVCVDLSISSAYGLIYIVIISV